MFVKMCRKMVVVMIEKRDVTSYLVNNLYTIYLARHRSHVYAYVG
jgi:hypothetical protein